MRYRSYAALPVLALPLLAACSGAPDAGSEETAAVGGSPGSAPTDVASRQPSARVPFLGGTFVTWAESMPIEVEQAAAGVATDRPVVVWAGLDATHADGAEKQTDRADRPAHADDMRPARSR
jgi:hypothetical protein